jgi:hypothetical protein
MFSGALMVVLVALILFRRIIWHTVCLVIGDKMLNRPVKTRAATPALHRINNNNRQWSHDEDEEDDVFS